MLLNHILQSLIKEMVSFKHQGFQTASTAYIHMYIWYWSLQNKILEIHSIDKFLFKEIYKFKMTLFKYFLRILYQKQRTKKPLINMCENRNYKILKHIFIKIANFRLFSWLYQAYIYMMLHQLSCYYINIWRIHTVYVCVCRSQ